MSMVKWHLDYIAYITCILPILIYWHIYINSEWAEVVVVNLQAALHNMLRQQIQQISFIRSRCCPQSSRLFLKPRKQELLGQCVGSGPCVLRPVHLKKTPFKNARQ